MLYKNIEIYNAAELIPCQGGGVTWRRVPQNVYENMEMEEQGKRMCGNSTGVELRFVIKGDKATVCMQSLSSESSVTSFHVFRGGIQGGWEDHEHDKYVRTVPHEHVIPRSKNLELLRRIAKESCQEWDPEVVRIIFDRGSYKIIDVIGDVEPPKKEQMPLKTILAYGSSITHGSNSINASHAWTSVLAHRLNMDCRNLGMAGSCALEPQMIDYIASEGEKGKWDIALLELGINVLGWENDKIIQRVTNTLRQVAGRNPNKKIVVISPFFCNDDYNKTGNAARWRSNISEIVSEMNFPNVTYIDGTELLGDMSLISADEVHPNIYGVAQIAQRLYERISVL